MAAFMGRTADRILLAISPSADPNEVAERVSMADPIEPKPVPHLGEWNAVRVLPDFPAHWFVTYAAGADTVVCMILARHKGLSAANAFEREQRRLIEQAAATTEVARFTPPDPPADLSGLSLLQWTTDRKREVGPAPKGVTTAAGRQAHGACVAALNDLIGVARRQMHMETLSSVAAGKDKAAYAVAAERNAVVAWLLAGGWADAATGVAAGSHRGDR